MVKQYKYFAIWTNGTAEEYEDIHGMREGEKVVDIEAIIKAYKFCKNNEGTCDKCSYFPKKSKLFGCPINKDMISAISEQKAEIDRLKAEKTNAFDYLFSKFAGHSNYHGDSVLCAIEAVKEGKKIETVKTLDEDGEKE